MLDVTPSVAGGDLCCGLAFLHVLVREHRLADDLASGEMRAMLVRNG